MVSCLLDSEVVAESVRRWGSTSAISIFDPRSRIFQEPGIEGLVGYRLAFGCAVAYGDPVAPKEHTMEMAGAFAEFCKSRNWSHVYVTGTQTFAERALGNVCQSALEIGEELYIESNANPRRGSKGRALRNKLNNSARSGIDVLEYLGGDLIVEEALNSVSRQWLKARRGPQIYLAPVDLFAQRHGKRYFYATKEGSVIGVLLLQEMASHCGWNMQLLMSTPDAPVGTTERLVMEALEALDDEHKLFFGVAQTGELGEITGLGTASEWVTRTVFKFSRHIFHLDLRRRYLRKFQPQAEPAYLLLSGRRIGVREVVAISQALNVSL